MGVLTILQKDFLRTWGKLNTDDAVTRAMLQLYCVYCEYCDFKKKYLKRIIDMK